MTTALLFPGQGSQSIGMGKALADDFPVAREVFAEVDDALGLALSAIVWGDDAEALTLTVNTQPALLAVSMAVLRVLQAERGFDLATHAAFVAGHSLGEYAALAAAGSLTLADAARLLRIRGQAMQDAVPVGVGTMAALLGIDFAAAVAVAAEAAQGEVCAAANDNAPGQVVVSGHRAAVARAMEIAKAHGARRAMLLPVSAPFHCALMQPAAAVMQAALADFHIAAPVVPVIANVTALPVDDPADIRRRLVEQVTGTVRWRESVAFMAAGGAIRFAEIGAGRVLTGLAKRIVPDATAEAVGTPDEVVAFAPG